MQGGKGGGVLVYSKPLPTQQVRQNHATILPCEHKRFCFWFSTYWVISKNDAKTRLCSVGIVTVTATLMFVQYSGMNTPAVSIVIPCFKGERYIAQAIKSCMAQTFDNLEIIVVDDASEDRCAEIADELAKKDKRIQIIQHPENRGVATAFNTGFNAAKGKYFTRLAQDDLFKPGAVRHMVEALEANTDTDMVYADMEYIDEHGSVTGLFHAKPPNEALHGCSSIGLCWMFRRTVWEREASGFDPAFDQIEDFEFWMRAARHSRLRHLAGPPLLQFRRHHKSGTSQYGARMELLSAKVLAKYAASKKAARKALAQGSFNASWIYRSQGQWKNARHEAFQALRHNPLLSKNYKNLLAALLQIRPGSDVT